MNILNLWVVYLQSSVTGTSSYKECSLSTATGLFSCPMSLIDFRSRHRTYRQNLSKKLLWWSSCTTSPYFSLLCNTKYFKDNCIVANRLLKSMKLNIWSNPEAFLHILCWFRFLSFPFVSGFKVSTEAFLKLGSSTDTQTLGVISVFLGNWRTISARSCNSACDHTGVFRAWPWGICGAFLQSYHMLLWVRIWWFFFFFFG